MKTYPFGVIGNCTSVALISSDCSIEWLCLPFFDSPSLFARILDQNKGGNFQITAQDIVNVKQNYIQNTAILRLFLKPNTVFLRLAIICLGFIWSTEQLTALRKFSVIFMLFQES